VKRIDVSFWPANVKDAQAYDAPLLGAGAIEIRDDGVQFTGHATPRTAAAVAGTLVGVINVLAAAVVLAVLDVDASHIELAYVAGFGAGILPGFGVYWLLHRRVRGRVIDALVPYPALRVLTLDHDRATVRLVSPELRGDVVIVATRSEDAPTLRALAGPSAYALVSE